MCWSCRSSDPRARPGARESRTGCTAGARLGGMSQHSESQPVRRRRFGRPALVAAALVAVGGLTLGGRSLLKLREHGGEAIAVEPEVATPSGPCRLLGKRDPRQVNLLYYGD